MAEKQYETAQVPLTDFDGKWVGVIVAKKTYLITEGRILVPAEKQEPVWFTDQLFEGDDPTLSPPKFESEIVLKKLKTDFIIHGIAYAPEGKRTKEFDVQAIIGNERRSLRIIGPRIAHWRKPEKETKKETIYSPPVFSEPEPVLEVPISYYYSYGGVAKFKVANSEDIIEIPCPSNPFGKGYCVQNSPEGLEGLELPLIEHPDALLTPENIVQELGAIEKTPITAGFGTFGRGWYPRVAYLGVMPYDVEHVKASVRESAKGLDPEKDATTIAMLSEFEPTVMSPEYFQCSAPGMAFPYLSGDESIFLRNMTPDGVFSFNLPGRVPLIHANLGQGSQLCPAVLDTVILLMEEMKVILTFRAVVPLANQEQIDMFPSLPIEVEDVDLVKYRQVLARREQGGF